MFLLSGPIYDNDFDPKYHWKMHTALPNPDINACPFVYILMGAFDAIQVLGLTSGSNIRGNMGILAQLMTTVGTYLQLHMVPFPISESVTRGDHGRGTKLKQVAAD